MNHTAHAEAAQAESLDACKFWASRDGKSFYLLINGPGGGYAAIRLNDGSGAGGKAGRSWAGWYDNATQATTGLVPAPSFTLRVERI